MPLMPERLPQLEHASSVQESTASAQGEDQYVEAFQDGQEGEEHGNMSNTSMIHRPRPKKPQGPPLVSQKSSRRASQTLDALAAKLQALQLSQNAQHPQSTASDPYESYVSSEEDASENADEYDETFIELDSESQTSISMNSRRASQEDTARVVSMIFVGKPQIVDIFHHRSLSADDASVASRRRPSPLRLDSNSSFSFRPSTSSPRSSSVPAMPTATEFAKTKRQSGMKGMANLTTKPPNSTLSNSSPIGSSKTLAQSPSQMSMSIPKTPSSLVQAAWRGSMKSMSRTISMAKKQPTVPKAPCSPYSGNFKSFSTQLLSLSTSTDPGDASNKSLEPSNMARSHRSPSLRNATNRMSMHADFEKLASQTDNAEPKEPPMVASQAPSYQEIMQNVIQGPPPTAQKSLKTKSSIMGLNLWKSKALPV